MKKQLLLLVMMLSAVNALAVEVEVDGLWYEIISKLKEAKVIQYKDGNKYSGNIVIPETVEYEGVTYNVTSIGNSAFYDCPSLTTIELPNSLTFIGGFAFAGCSNLFNITLSNNITTIEDCAFRDCISLLSVSIPNNVTHLGSYVFNNTAWWNNQENGVIYLDNWLIGVKGNELNGHIVIADGTKGIACCAFFGCNSITSVIVPNSVISIPHFAFGNCSGLTSITIPNSVKSIEHYAFDYCSCLTSITIGNNVTSIGNSAFRECSSLSNIIYTSDNPPSNWIATTNTYVPNKSIYTNPSFINGASGSGIKEMISFEPEFTYSGREVTPTWTNNVFGYNASLSMSSFSGEVGNHEERVPVKFTKENESFTANVVYRYTIKPVKLTAKVSNASREYGEENPQFSISYSGFVSDENESVLTTLPTISTTATKKSKVGDYPITISGGSAKNYEFVYEPGVLTITKAPLSATVNDTTKVYGSSNPAFSIGYYGLKNDEIAPAWSKTPTFKTEATQSSSVGKYEVKAVNGVPVNYDLGEITAGTLSVTPAPLTIKANDATRQYYSDEPNFGYTCNGFVNGENKNVLSPEPTFTTTANKSSNVGTYPIKASGASSSNYSISYVDGTLTITHRTLYASVGNYERVYNEDNPDFEVKYDGFVENEDENVLITKATASTTATKTSDVGSYSINVTGGSADNYKFSYTLGTLTINKAEQIISWEQDLSNLKVGDQVELQAVASSGLAITYKMDNNDVAEIYSAGNNKTYLDCKAEGQFTIRATQEGNKNYYSSARVSKTVVIGGESAVKALENSLAKIQRTPYGIRVIKANIGDVIQVYSADGVLHRSVKVEGENTDIRLSKGTVYVIKVGTRTMKIGL